MPVLLVRHAAAGDRRAWDGDDASRPLDERGRRQAAGLVEALAGFDVARVVSSPAERCRQTVDPLALGRDLPVIPDDDLFEGNSPYAVALVLSLLAPASGTAGADGPAVALCSHGDVIPEVLAVLEREGARLGEVRRCKKASTWAVWREPGGGVAARYLPPPA